MSLRNINLHKNPFLLFLPFLILYIFLVLIFPTNGKLQDEPRYLMFAQNFLHGFYSPPAPNIDIGDGPGYPILLMPFLALGLPLISITILNAVLYYLSIIVLFKALEQVISFRMALIFSLFWACYYNSYQNMPFIHPEIFTAFLISLLLFYLVASFNRVNSAKTRKYAYFCGFIIGYIALSKIIFGYVLITMIIVTALLFFLNRKNENYKKALLILFTAFVTTMPYLVYTYYMTNKVLYWGTAGGENFYWMSTPFKGEYGNWVQYPIDSNIKKNTIPGAEELIKMNHQKDLKEILKYKGSIRDDAYRKAAINNIRSHPVKFFQNIISNIGRILFNYPYSYTPQKNSTLFRLPLSGTMVVFMLYSLIPTFINWRRIMFPIRFLLVFVLIYLGGSLLASAETRMFTIVLPILIFWVAFIIQKTIKLKNW